MFGVGPHLGISGDPVAIVPDVLNDLQFADGLFSLTLRMAGQEDVTISQALDLPPTRKEMEAKMAEIEGKLTSVEKEAENKANARVIRAELKAHAVKLGMIDLDGLTFVDVSKLKFDEKGDLVGADEALTKLKESKPYLFGETKKSTSNGTTTPPASGDGQVDARKLSKDEYAALKKKMGVR